MQAAEPIVGRAGIEAAIARFFTAFVALRCQIYVDLTPLFAPSA